MKKIAALLLLAGTSVLAQPKATIVVDSKKVENSISPLIYGACIEDVNHECYGGIYDQKLFGESFEEPSARESFPGFTKYEGVWTVEKGIVGVSTSRGCKLVYEKEYADGAFETDIRFDNDRGVRAGVVVRLSDPGPGFNNFRGYSVSLSSIGGYLDLCKHDHNEVRLVSRELKHDPYKWVRLRVETEGAAIRVYLDGKLEIEYTDEDRPFLSGKAAFRDLQSDTYYRRPVLEADGAKLRISFSTPENGDVSRQWKPVSEGTAKAWFKLGGGAFHGRRCQGFGLRSGDGRVGIANMSLNGWGICVRKGEPMEGCVFLRRSWRKAAVSIALESADGSVCYAVQEIGVPERRWGRYDFRLTPEADDAAARFVIYTCSRGRVKADFAQLFCTGERQKNGYPLRADVADAMMGEGLKMLRYGGTMINVPGYRFKNMIGPREQRPPYRGHWYWWATNGFGIEEFVQLCEACGFEAAVAVNVLEDAQDMADMVEYLNGPASSKWGAERAANGHPEPYGVHYFEIGNEEVIIHESEAAFDFYIDKFNAIHDAMVAVDPSIETVCALQWRPDLEEDMHRVFDAVDGKAAYWDYHPWADFLVAGENCDKGLTRMEELFKKWNPDTKMKCIIFEENGDTHNMRRTLGHVTIKNAVRRHGEFVQACCAANALQPWLQNDNSWNQGQVFLTPDKVWGQPQYYAQKMASEHHRSLRVFSEVSGPLDVTATRDEDEADMVLHIANIQPGAVKARVDVSSFGKVRELETITLQGRLGDTNTPDNPERISPVSESLAPKAPFDYTFPANSYTIIVVR